MAIERTLSIIKPDAAAKPGVAGEILSRFEKAGLEIVAMKKMRLSKEMAEGFYAVHKERPFFGELVQFMTSGPVVALALEGKNAIEVTRNLMGKTNAAEAAPGTIRGDFGLSFSNNLVHGSDGPESATTELALFFPKADELCEWTPAEENWVYSVEER